MALSNIEKHYNKHPEDLRLLRRHGMVEFETTMHHLRRFLRPGQFILDIGAGTGRYTSALMAEGYQVKAVELVRHNIDVFLKREPTADVVQGDARNMPFIPDDTADVTLLLGPLYHLIGDEDKLKALNEAKRVTKPGGIIFIAYLMNEYSILSYCFDEDRISDLKASGVVDEDYHLHVQPGELYDYVRLEDIDRLNEEAGLERVTIFSPDGASDYMRTRLNRMGDETFSNFIEYQKCISERQDLIGAGSHVVDVVKISPENISEKELKLLLPELRDLMVQNGWTVSTAESCTGGRIAALLTEVSGSSRYYQGGVVAYQNEVKTRELGVPSEMIATYNVVSEPVVREMVRGVCRKFNTTYGIASTGYAEGWEGHQVEIWIGWGQPDNIHTLHLTQDDGRLENVERASKIVIKEFMNSLRQRH